MDRVTWFEHDVAAEEYGHFGSRLSDLLDPNGIQNNAENTKAGHSIWQNI